MWAPRTAPRLLSLQVQQGSCRAQKNSPSTGVSISAGITVLGSNQLGSGGWPCITPSLASTSVALEEPSGNSCTWVWMMGGSQGGALAWVVFHDPCGFQHALPQSTVGTQFPPMSPSGFQSSKVCSQQQWRNNLCQQNLCWGEATGAST